MLLEASTGVEEARQVAERIREGLQVPFNINGQEVFLKASIGIASDEADARTNQSTLREIGREMAQGYYFAKPLPSEALERLLEEGISY